MFKQTRLALIVIMVSGMSWGSTPFKASDQPVFKSKKIVATDATEITPRSLNSRIDTTTIFFDDMEGGTDDWTFGVGWAETTSSSSSPTTSLNIDDDNYGTVSELLSPTISLPLTTSENEFIKFNFDLWCDLPDFDGDGDNSLDDYYQVDIANLDEQPTYFHTSTNGAFSGSSWWCADQTIGGYNNTWLQFLDTPTISIPNGVEVTLSAQMKWGIEDPAGASVPPTCTNGWDAANVRISNDGGTTWYLLTGSGDPYDFTDGYGWIFNDPEYYDCQDLAAGWGGIQDWHLVTLDLTPYAGQDVIIRFGFGSDPGWSTPDDPTIDGLRIDDISVETDGGSVLFTDDADGPTSDMIPVNGFDIQWTAVFYDYGDVSRPGGTGWQTLMPGDPFNGNTELDITEHAGADVKFRFVARIDDNDDGGNGSGLYIDDFHVWSVLLEEELPTVTGVYAEAGDAMVHVTWNDLNVDASGDVIYDDGQFDPNESISMLSGTSVCGTLFDMPFGTTTVTVNTVSVYGDVNASGPTTIYGYGVNLGIPDPNPTYSTAVTSVAGEWTDVEVDWSFSGDFVIGYEISTIIACVIDTDVPGNQAHSWSNLGGWQDWTDVATSTGLPDGEWGIRATVSDVDGAMAVYNVYRSVNGGGYILLFNGQNLSDPEYTDYIVQNDSLYCYKVTAEYDENEGPQSAASCATPEAQTIHEIAYDDGVYESSTNVGPDNYLAVKMTPLQYPSEVKRVKFYIPTGNPGPCLVHIWDDDGEDNLPESRLTPPDGVTMQLGQGWNIKDVANLNIRITDGDFYVGWEETDYTPPLGIDITDPDFRSFINVAGPPPGTDGLWVNLYVDGDFMVRVDVDSGVLATGDGLDDPIPTTYTLGQNYPNPFNPVTNIEFDIPEFSRVHLALYNLAGQEVMTIINNENLNVGPYHYTVNGASLPSGVYIYRIMTTTENGTNFSDAKKLVLLK